MHGSRSWIDSPASKYSVTFVVWTTQPHPQTFGQKRVRAEFNPSKTGRVDTLKNDSALLIDQVHTISLSTEDPEVKRLCSLAMTAYEEAAMWAVKAATAMLGK